MHALDQDDVGIDQQPRAQTTPRDIHARRDAHCRQPPDATGRRAAPVASRLPTLCPCTGRLAMTPASLPDNLNGPREPCARRHDRRPPATAARPPPPSNLTTGAAEVLEKSAVVAAHPGGETATELPPLPRQLLLRALADPRRAAGKPPTPAGAAVPSPLAGDGARLRSIRSTSNLTASISRTASGVLTPDSGPPSSGGPLTIRPTKLGRPV
nr:early nodulin-like protein 2 [Lolium perenne]